MALRRPGTFGGPTTNDQRPTTDKRGCLGRRSSSRGGHTGGTPKRRGVHRNDTYNQRPTHEGGRSRDLRPTTNVSSARGSLVVGPSRGDLRPTTNVSCARWSLVVGPSRAVLSETKISFSLWRVGGLRDSSQEVSLGYGRGWTPGFMYSVRVSRRPLRARMCVWGGQLYAPVPSVSS